MKPAPKKLLVPFFLIKLLYTRTVDGRNPANQLRLVVNPIVYRVLYINSSTMGQMERDLFRFLFLSCQETPRSAESIESSPQFVETV